MPNTYGAFRTLEHPAGRETIDALVIRLTNAAFPCCQNPMGLDNIIIWK
jgi:hypothetical protein